MKKVALVFMTTLLLLGGCRYTSPVSEPQGLPLDPALFGVWQQVNGPEKADEPERRMVILPLSEHEYLVHYHTLYFRAWPIKIGAVECIQVELLGSEKDGPLKRDNQKRFDLWSVQTDDSGITGKILNAELVDAELKKGAGLKKGILKHAGNPELFTRPFRFHRIATEAPAPTAE